MLKRTVAACAGAALALAAHAAVAAPSPVAHAYLERALDLMATHSLHRDALDFAAIRARAFAAAEGARAPQETWPAIRAALAELGDRHSALLTPSTAVADDRGGAAPLPEARLLPGGIAYLSVPAHPGGSVDADTAYADALQTLIFKLDAADACGWIVDLRDNPGGNMWPMLAGLAPLFDATTVGAFQPPDGPATPWWVDGGSAGAGERVQAASHYAIELDGPAPTVAVLLGPRTASSGEAVAVAFRGRADTRFFGEPTHGVPTGNRGFVLGDGAVLFVAASRFADRAGRVVDGPLRPDHEVAADDARDAASAWLQGHARCRTMRR